MRSSHNIMLETPSLNTYPLILRVVVLIALAVVTYRFTKKGFHNGILLGLITGASPIVLFRDLPGLPIISMDRVVWPIVLGVFLIKRSRNETERLRLDLIERSLLAFMAVMLISMIAHGTYVSTGGEWSLFIVLRGFVFPSMAYFMVRRAAAKPSNLHSFIVGLGYFGLYLAVTGLLEVFHIDQLIFPQFVVNPKIGIHFGHARGIFVNASVLGLALATALPFLVWLFFHDRAPRRYLWAFAAVVSALPLIYTFQRAAWLSALLAMGVTAVAWPKRRLILTWGLMFAVVCGFWLGSEALMKRLESRTGNTSTIEYRLAHIERGWAMFRENPVVGVGINRYNVEVEKYTSSTRNLKDLSHAHNTWITLLAELGLIGFVAYVIPFILVLSKCLLLYLRYPRHRAFLGILAGITLGFLMMSVSIDLRTDLYSHTFLFTFWAMILGTMRRPEVSREAMIVNPRRSNSQSVAFNRSARAAAPLQYRPRWP